jgi:hypothetical protein
LRCSSHPIHATIRIAKDTQNTVGQNTTFDATTVKPQRTPERPKQTIQSLGDATESRDLRS